MYGLIQTIQAPLQCNWCGNGLQSSASSPFQLLNALSGSPVYISPNGTSPSVYANQRGTLTYTFTKSGATTGTSTGTASSTTSFTDSKTGGTGTTSNYTLTINDSNTGQQYIYLNSVVWGAV
jgi:hypothetical protein